MADNIVKSSLNDYESVYKIDLNFDTEVSGLTADVISAYVARVLANHPYYVDISQIVDIIVDEETNKITVVVSDKEVGERLNNLSNSTINLSDVAEQDIYNYQDNSTEAMNNLNKMYTKDTKYILDYKNPEGETYLYEYDFGGFNKAQSLIYDKHVVLNGNKKRHFMRNSNDNPYYYDEYINSKLNYVNSNDLKKSNELLNPNNPLNVKRNMHNTNVNDVAGSINDINNVSRAVNDINNLGGAVNDINNVTGAVNDIAGSINDVTGAVNDINNVTGAVNDIAGSINDVTGAVNDMNNVTGAVNDMNNVTGAVNDVTGAVNDVTGAVNDIAGSINDVTGAVNDVTGSVNDVNYINNDTGDAQTFKLTNFVIILVIIVFVLIIFYLLMKNVN